MRPKSFDELNVFYPEPYEHKSIGNWARQLLQHIPAIKKIPVADPKLSLKRSYIENGVEYVNWFKKTFYDHEIDLMIMSEALNYAPLFTINREYFKALPTVMFIHCTELDFNPLIRSASSMWGELGALSLVDRVHFFSDFSRRITLERAKEFLSTALLDKIADKSVVFPLPMHLRDLDSLSITRIVSDTPTIVYNHRLDPDKGYLIFLNALDEIHNRGIDFRLYLCGEPSSSKREPLVQAYLQRWGNKVVHYGLVKDRTSYATMLFAADIVVNSSEEVMGISMCEAAYCGAWPIVFNEGALPAIFSTDCDTYNTTEELIQVLEKRLKMPIEQLRAMKLVAKRRVEDFDWQVQTDKYKQSWYSVYEKKMKTDGTTGAVDRVKAALANGPLTKKDVLLKVLKWGSFDYWPIYRYRLLMNGVDYQSTTNTYQLEQTLSSIISVKEEPEMKELPCKVCNTNKVKVSDDSHGGICSECVMSGRFYPGAPIPKPVDENAPPPPPQPSRYGYKSGAKHGERSKIVDTLLLSGKDVATIIEEVKKKFPGEDGMRIRSLVYIRRGALKQKGKLKEKSNA